MRRFGSRAGGAHPDVALGEGGSDAHQNRPLVGREKAHGPGHGCGIDSAAIAGEGTPLLAQSWKLCRRQECCRRCRHTACSGAPPAVGAVGNADAGKSHKNDCGRGGVVVCQRVGGGCAQQQFNRQGGDTFARAAHSGR